MKKMMMTILLMAGMLSTAMAQTPGTPETRDIMAKYTIGVHHVAVPVVDMQQTIDFYTSLGFKIEAQPMLGQRQFTFMRMGNLLMEFYKTDHPALKAGAVDHFCLEVTDIDKTFEAVKNGGYEFENGNARISSLPNFFPKGSKCFKIIGPNKEIIEFFEVTK